MFNLNQYLLDPQNIKPEFQSVAAITASLRQVRPIVCADGLKFSAQASASHYCAPRNSQGPWETVEIGFPNRSVPEFMEYAEEADKPTDTVYGYVPVEIVEAVIEAHGGIVSPTPAPCRA
jgi:hypothetical protein